MSEKVAPPPRKIKASIALKNSQSEQLAKLQIKHQQECDLLEDLRTFSKQRSVIEKEYAQALLKLTSQLQKREFNASPELNNSDGEHKTAVTLWHVILDETEKMAKSRLAASDTYIEKIHEPLKQVKLTKTQVLKKVTDQLAVIQNEVSICLREMLKSQKIYTVDEALAHDSRQKSTDCENRLKRKSKGLFQSVGSIQRNCAKLSSRKESCEVKSTSSRNEYLFNMAASNAHQVRYFTTDLPHLMKQLDTDVYERLQEFYTILGTTSAECSGIEQECFSAVLSQATLVSGEYNKQCFLHDHPVFTKLIQYQFEPCNEDSVNTLSSLQNTEIELEKEARKWATKIARENKTTSEAVKTLHALESGDTLSVDALTASTSECKDTAAAGVEIENKLDEIRETIRKSETSKMKAEARIEILRDTGVNVDQWINSAQMDMLSPGIDDLTRTPSQVSLRTESSGVHSEEVDQTYRNYDDEEEDDFTDDMFETTQNEHNSYVSSQRSYPITCSALYDFQANNADELSIASLETLDLIADGDGDGWVKARNSVGATGFIPENYVQLPTDQITDPSQTIEDYDPTVRDSVSSGEFTATISEPLSPPFSPDYSQELPPLSPQGDASQPLTNETAPDVTSYTSSDYEVQDVNDIVDLPPPEGQWCRAIYDYEATNDEELSFFEGQLVKILRKDDNGVDDGWWEGEVDGRTGVFPSIVVEEVSGVDVSQEYSGTITTPSYAATAPPVMVTLPTPEGEYEGSFESTTDDIDPVNEEVTGEAVPEEDVTETNHEI